jgi:hypothetical protein
LATPAKQARRADKSYLEPPEIPACWPPNRSTMAPRVDRLDGQSRGVCKQRRDGVSFSLLLLKPSWIVSCGSPN